MFCQFCGTQLSSAARFCKNCGARMEDSDDRDPQPQALPSGRTGGNFPRPWRQNENAIILPITPDLTGEDWNQHDPDVSAQAASIGSIDSPRQTRLIPREDRVQAPRPRPHPLEPPPGIQLLERAEQVVSPRRGRLASAVPLLLLAVLFLFVLAYFATK